jgi:hypothetical protein
MLAYLVLVACSPPGSGIASADEVKNEPQAAKEPSPLHDLLGIDPETGQFKPPRPPRDPREESKPLGTAPASTAGGTSAEQNHPGDLNDFDEATRTIEELANRIQHGNQPRGGGELEALSAILGETLSNERILTWNRTFAWTTAAVLMIYPLGLIMSELVAFFWWPREAILTDADRRYLRTRFWRRMTLAAAIAGLILIATLATVNVAWWSDPVKLSVLAVTGAVLGLAASTLSSLVEQAAGERSLEMMRDVRQQQMELRKDMDELRKRLRQVTIHGG